MAEKYTIENSMPTGKTHDMYGTEYQVKFHQNEGTFKLWYKQAPTVGQEQEGTIDGWKFTKAKKEYTPAPTGESKSAEIVQKPKPAYAGKTFKDNSDGMRQGMCFNNASNYVNAISSGTSLTPKQWSKSVFGYAKELYDLGDLNQEAPKEDLMETVQEVFGLKK